MAIDFSIDNGVGVITFNRPPANAYDAQMLVELTAAVHRVAEDPAVRVALVRSANPKFFCTGADIGTLQHSSRAQFANFLTIAAAFTLSTAKNFALQNCEFRDMGAALNFAQAVKSTGAANTVALYHRLTKVRLPCAFTYVDETMS